MKNKIEQANKTFIELESKIQSLLKENQKLSKENDKLRSNSEMNTSHLDTKVHLLKEALNKRNDDIKELENSNDDLVCLLEKWDEKLFKLDEDYKLEKIKWEKYEQELGKRDKDFSKIDIETIDGRISFMVNILEEYRKMLEEDSQFDSEKGSFNDESNTEEVKSPTKTENSV